MAINWNAGSLRWWPHVDGEKHSYSLAHLHPFRFEYTLPAEKGHAERTLKIQVGFGLHCFTRKRLEADAEGAKYSDDREVRTFDHERYELSKQLRRIVENLVTRQCRFAKHENFLVVEIITADGQTIEYGVFFNVKRLKRSEPLNPPLPEPLPELLLVVQSAYKLDPEKSRPHGHDKIHFKALIGHAVRGTSPKRKR